MSFMKAPMAALALLTGICTAETKSQCIILVKVDSIMYADTKDETIDSVTVCDDGKATAFHSFTAPALGDAPPEPTKWDYDRDIGKDVVADLQKFATRKDIAGLPERVSIVKKRSALDIVMRFKIVDQGTVRTITLQTPSLACTEEHPEMPNGVWDLICVFADLYNRVKTGIPPENGCGCKALHELAVFR
jgi:hypothetical protein